MQQTLKFFFTPSLMIISLIILVACGTVAPSPDATPDEDLSDHEHMLAELIYADGRQVIFSYDETLGDFALSQEGRVGESEPIDLGENKSFLQLFLELTPDTVAVPELLLSEPDVDSKTLAQAKLRLSSKTLVVATQVATPGGATLLPLGASCNSTFITNPHYAVLPQSGLADKSYYSSWYGGKYRYVDSYLINCTPASFSDSFWVRHRIYYKNAFGNYVKHYEKKIAPWHWQIKRKGSLVKRYRRVHYDDNWNNCASCKYGREGKFLN